MGGRRMGGEVLSEKSVLHHSGSATLARRRGENAKIGHLAPLLGKPIYSCGIAVQDTFCIAKHRVLENGCPFGIGLLHNHDQIPKQNGGARHKPQNLLEIFNQK